jgi:hypothetical protein
MNALNFDEPQIFDLDGRLMQKNKSLEELGDRLFKQAHDSVFGYEFEKDVANIKERFAHAGALRSSSFAWEIADAILSRIRSLREVFLESYLQQIGEGSDGLTDEGLIWLRTKLEAIWEPEVLDARARLCSICEGVNLTSKDAQSQAAKVEVEGRKIKLSVINDLDIAALRRDQSRKSQTPPSGQKPYEDFSFVQNLHIRSILLRDYAELGTLDSTIQLKALLILSGGVIEGLLLDAIITTGKWDLAEGSRKTLKQLIDEAISAGVIRQDRLSHVAREYRDLVHPGREVRENMTFTSDDADISRAAVGVTIREIKEWNSRRPNRS